MEVIREFNHQKAEAFAGKLIQILNDAALALMTSIGHRTGLFDAMSQLPPSTSKEIADAADLNERYVREWLGAVTVGGIVECEPNGPRFSLPREHAGFLTRAAGADNISVFAQYVAMMGSAEDRIIKCFQKGGGVPYEEFTRFHEVMAEDSGQSVLSSLFSSILPLVPGLFEQLEKGITVLDVGCGQGHALNLMAKRFPNSRFAGYDLSQEAISSAKMRAEKEGLGNLRFEQKDLTSFNIQEQFHLVTAFDAIHDQARPDQVLAGIARVLRPDGVFLMQDIAASSYVHKNFDQPIAPFLYAISCMHCMTVSLAQGGMGLGAMWGEEKALEMLREAGFGRVEVKRLPHDFQNCYYVVRKY